MTHYISSLGLTAAVSLAMTGLLFAGEPTGIGEKGTGQTQKSTERQQSGTQPDMSQVPEELRQGKSAQAAKDQELGAMSIKRPLSVRSDVEDCLPVSHPLFASGKISTTRTHQRCR